MDGSNGIMPVMPIGNSADGFGNNSFLWVFALLLLAGGGGFGGFGWGNNGIGNYATEATMQRGFDTQNLQAQTRDILAAVNDGTAQAVAATNQTFHDSLAAMQGLYNETARDIAALQVGQANALANQNQCCCEQKMLVSETGASINANIAQSRYDAALNTASINATTTAQTQRILDAIAQNKIEALQAQVNELQLAQATSGVVRYPMSWTYNAGMSPFCGCNGCGV